MHLHDKIAIVTGGGSGLGRATCDVLNSAGAKVWAFERDPERVVSLRQHGTDTFEVLEVDVSDEPQVREAVEHVRRRAGALHIAVNCAGILRGARTISRGNVFPTETWDRVIATNLTGTFNVLKYAALAMSLNVPDAVTGERGVIVNVSSGAATQGQIGQAAYTASKAAIAGMTLPVARDLADHAIRVVAVSPGLFDTSMVGDMSSKTSDSIIDRMVLFPKRRGRPEEFARLVRHIIENVYLNATTIDLDAGTRMSAR